MNPKEIYSKYLSTDYWKAVAAKVKQNAKFKCQLCNNPQSLDVHHRSYEHRGDEMNHLEDLICLCRRCHKLYHGHLATPSEPFKTPTADELVLITDTNHAKMKMNKDVWHWLSESGLKPAKAGWKRRSIGHLVPRRFLKKL